MDGQPIGGGSTKKFKGKSKKRIDPNTEDSPRRNDEEGFYRKRKQNRAGRKKLGPHLPRGGKSRGSKEGKINLKET